MRALADAMSPKVTAQAISKYEAGKMLPSSAVLVGLGKVLDVSPGLPDERAGRGARRG